MRAVVQRVSRARVVVGEETVGAIDRGLLLLAAVEQGDGPEQAAWLARKVSRLRMFPDDTGRMNRSVLDIGGAVLAVSQFTLAADLRKGDRPSFTGAAAPDLARPLFERLCTLLEQTGLPVARGRFGADMAVHLVNDGPVTFQLVSAPVD
ncbi:MAG: D-tyrosyl-tRNA(Tyr) deacylase [Magnetococcales bacterium]|nr:D-tyrosyl-tRNA(Tyr) deacylase [Magnetococcales bacterium]